MRRSLALALGLAALGLPLRAARATPENIEGYGSRETALAGAVAAHVPNGSAVFYNPSGLVEAPSSELSLGYASAGYALSENGTHGIPLRRGFDASVLGRGRWLGLPVAFGLAAGLSNGHLSRNESLSAADPRWILYDPQTELIDIGADVACRPFEWLSLGAGLGFLAAMAGHFDVTGTARVSNGSGSEYDSQLRHGVRADLLTVRYPTLGLTAHALPWLSLALAYRGRATLRQSISGTLAGKVDAGFAQIPIRYDFVTEGVIAFQPQELTFAAEFQIERTSFELDLGWQDWSSYPSPVARSGSQVTAVLPPGFMLNLPPDRALPAEQSAHFSSRLVPRLAVEHTLTLASSIKLVLRAGYAYEASPLSSPEPAHLVDSARQTVALGSGVRLLRLGSFSKLELSTHLIWGHHASRTLHSDAAEGPVFFRAAGDMLGAGMSVSVGF